eukprot:3098602-Prymnesium_polylepis.2
MRARDPVVTQRLLPINRRSRGILSGRHRVILRAQKEPVELELSHSEFAFRPQFIVPLLDCLLVCQLSLSKR